jgi:hypothetical protein
MAAPGHCPGAAMSQWAGLVFAVFWDCFVKRSLSSDRKRRHIDCDARARAFPQRWPETRGKCAKPASMREEPSSTTRCASSLPSSPRAPHILIHLHRKTGSPLYVSSRFKKDEARNSTTRFNSTFAGLHYNACAPAWCLGAPCR